MEPLERCSVSLNEYERNEVMQKRDAVKTENIYQSLQYPPTTAHKPVNNRTSISDLTEHGGRKFVFLLFGINILMSAIILAIVGLNYSHTKETLPIQVANGYSAGEKEVWLLYDNVFYLFWSDHSDCQAAESFCSQRNASLAILTEQNMAWLKSKSNDKPFFVLRTPLDGSGVHPNPLWEADVLQIEDHECGIITMNSDIAQDHGEGFVCERAGESLKERIMLF